jgi:neutral ceramidase
MPRQVALDARALIEQSPGIPAERVMISATHTHTGPVLPSGSTRDPSEGDGADKARAYVGSLPELIARAVRAADAKLAPADARVGVGREERLSFNRRFEMKDGSVGWNPGKLNPQIVKPVGPIDPDVPVVSFASPEGKILATYVNFTMHLDTVGGLRVSADYPGALSALLAKLHGPEAVTVFSTGACGDINHIDVSSGEPQGGPGEARRIGTVLAGEVLKTSARLRPLAGGALRARHEVVPLPLAEVREGDLERARKVATTFGKDEPTFMEKVQAFKVLDVVAREGKPLEAEVQVVAIGDDLALVALPGEIFVELGLDIKKRSPFAHTIIVELANGSVGYVPTRRAFTEGNYEPVSARCAPGSGEQLADAAVRLLNELHRDSK